MDSRIAPLPLPLRKPAAGVLMAALLMWLPAAGHALTAEQIATLESGEPVVDVHIDSRIDAARVRATIDVPAPPQRVWTVMTDCARAMRFIPGLKSCRVIERAPDGRWDVREHKINWAWFMPNIRTVFRAEYERPRFIRFRRIAGDLKSSDGQWRLAPREHGKATRLHYEAVLSADVPAPDFIVVETIRKDMATVLRRLREECVR